MKVVYIPIGFQGAGKTTFCQWMQKNFPQMHYVSLDRIASIAEEDEYVGKLGNLALQAALYLTQEITCPDQSIILDSWVINARFVKKLQNLGFKVVCWQFRVPETTCFERYKAREFPKVIQRNLDAGIDSVNPNTINEALWLAWNLINKTRIFPDKNWFDLTHLVFDERLENLNPQDFLFSA